MTFFKYAAWATLALIPLLLMKKGAGGELSQTGRQVESEEIFDYDLGAD